MTYLQILQQGACAYLSVNRLHHEGKISDAAAQVLGDTIVNGLVRLFYRYSPACAPLRRRAAHLQDRLAELCALVEAGQKPS